MEKSKFLTIVNELTGYDKIDVLLVDKSGGSKWYEKKYKLIDTLAEGNTYCFWYDGIHEFEFSFAKIENCLKSFFTKYVIWEKKNEARRALYFGTVAKTDTEIKESILKKLGNSERVEKLLFYTTLYGIGIFVLFGGDYVKESVKKMETYLNKNGIGFDCEYSEAHWVYRFLIKKDVAFHNQLLRNF